MKVYDLEAHGARWSIEADPASLLAHRFERGVPYELPLLEWIAAEVTAPGLAVDVGAHIGNHTLWLAAVCGRHVEAFEPIEYLALERNQDLNPDVAHRIHVHRCALGAERGHAVEVSRGTLQVVGTDHGAALFPVRTLDEYRFDPVAVVKVDVEGMEGAVLAGGRETITRCRPALCIEARDPADHNRLAATLEPMGYRLAERLATATPVDCWVPA